jgi:hypothetical protein
MNGQSVSHQPISSECTERNRLTRKIGEAVAAVYALKERQAEERTKNDASLPILLDQALAAERNAERALHDHITEHGCSRSH